MADDTNTREGIWGLGSPLYICAMFIIWCDPGSQPKMIYLRDVVMDHNQIGAFVIL